jgi:hypothetical protein
MTCVGSKSDTISVALTSVSVTSPEPNRVSTIFPSRAITLPSQPQLPSAFFRRGGGGVFNPTPRLCDNHARLGPARGSRGLRVANIRDVYHPCQLKNMTCERKMWPKSYNDGDGNALARTMSGIGGQWRGTAPAWASWGGAGAVLCSAGSVPMSFYCAADWVFSLQWILRGVAEPRLRLKGLIHLRECFWVFVRVRVHAVFHE